jgi:DNA-directed RNA polymerase alpha subunit
MQIQRVKTVNELQGLQTDQTFGVVGSNLVTKDYFESNPVFYYCYRIFPFERGHGIFVANSIRRFLLYEIPTIAITSVLIHSKEPSSDPNHVDFSSQQSWLGTEKIDEKTNSEVQNVVKPNLPKSSAAQLKKKKVTKKALKEQAAELFSYSLDNFPVPFKENLETEEVSSLTEFTTIPFVRESFLEILLNLKACVFENIFAFDQEQIGVNNVDSTKGAKVLKGKLILNASQESLDDPTEISKELFFQKDFDQLEPTKLAAIESVNVAGRRVRQYKIWAKDLILPPGLKVRNPDLVLATLVAPKTNCELELSFEKIFQSDLTSLSMKTGRVPHRAEENRRNVPIDGTLFPIKKVNFALSYTKFQKEIITFEIWTNGSLNPRQAIFQSVDKILALFQNLREDRVKEIDSFSETALDEFEETE